MDSRIVFLLLLGIALTSLLTWGIRTLHAGRWQVMAAVPLRPDGNGGWEGLNLTWYGFFSALSYVAAALLFFILTASVGAGPGASAAVAAMILVACIPASKLVARIVEGKRHTFTVGGASFAGIILAWPAVAAVDLVTAAPLPRLPMVAALGIAYALGEGIGRLACISFGCCYGRPVESLPAPLRRLPFMRGVIFTEPTRKAVYEGGYAGVPLAPVQAITAVLYCAAAVTAVALYLYGIYGTAMVAAIGVTQGWRFVSEFLRADYRGEQKISAYQLMAAAGLAYVGVLALLLGGDAAVIPDPARSLPLLGDPLMLGGLMLLGIGTFLYTGRSSVTAATCTFHVVRDRV